MYKKIQSELNKLKNPIKAKILQRFFKTGRGEYGEGDKFLGVVVPLQRQIAKKFIDVSLNDIQKLLDNEIHEYRLTGLLILVDKYAKVGTKMKKQIYDFYLKNTKHINNWDLVDLTAPKIVGDFLLDKDKQILYKLAESKNLWERRIAMLAAFAFIKKDNFKDALKLAKLLLNDEHDLMHKATGWMLREIGKRKLGVLIDFLDKYSDKMPRTMLRYAIERLPETKRRYYLNKK